MRPPGRPEGEFLSAQRGALSAQRGALTAKREGNHVRRIASRWMIGAAALVICVGARGDEAPRPDAFALTVDVARGAATGPLLRAPLPADVLRYTRSADLADLRVFDARGTLLPFAVRVVKTEAESPTAAVALDPLPILARSRDELSAGRLVVRQHGGQTTVEIAGGAPAVPAAKHQVVAYLFDARAVKAQTVALELDADFDAGRLVPVTIEASRDLKQWTTLASGEPVFRLGDADGAQRKRIALARVKLDGEHYLRLTWRNSETFALRGATLTTAEGAPPAPEKTRLLLKASAASAREVELDLPSPVPIAELEVNLSSADSLVPLTAFARRRTGELWQSIGRTVAYRLSGKDTEKDAESISPPFAVRAGSYQSLKLVADATAAGFEGEPQVAAVFPPRELVFLARGEGPYLIAVGLADAKPAALSLASLMPGYKEGAESALPLAVIGRAQVNERRVPTRTRWYGFDVRSWALWGVLIGAVLILAAFAWRLARKVAPPAGSASTESANAP